MCSGRETSGNPDFKNQVIAVSPYGDIIQKQLQCAFTREVTPALKALFHTIHSHLCKLCPLTRK